MNDVFISYARKDKPVAEALHAVLSEDGWEVWWDDEIYAGAAWNKLLRGTLKEAKAVVVLWSPLSITREWVLDEARLAFEQRKLVPARIAECEPPAPFGKLQHVDLFGLEKDVPHPNVDRLTQGLMRLAVPSRIDTVRPGFDTAFLGTEIGLPAVTGVAEELRYLHFSVVMNPARRLAWYVAYNIGQMVGTAPQRSDEWMPDPLLPRSFQPRNQHYAGTGYDRGHIARAKAVTWGDPRAAGIANRQAFFWTNVAPQLPDVNRRTWAALEDWEARVAAWRGKACGFSGPVMRPDDLVHGAATETIGRLVAHQTFRLPKAFWKVVVAHGDDGELRKACFLLAQDAAPRMADAVRDSRVTLAMIEDITGLEFPAALRECGDLQLPAAAALPAAIR